MCVARRFCIKSSCTLLFTSVKADKLSILELENEARFCVSDHDTILRPKGIKVYVRTTSGLGLHLTTNVAV